MVIKKHITCLIVLSTLLCSCSVLSRSQLKTIDRYYTNIENYGLYYRTLQRNLADIRYNRKLLYPKSYSSDTIMVSSLKQAYNEFQSDLKGFDKNINTINQIDSYLKEYKGYVAPPKKISNENEYTKKIKDFSSYIPFGIGTSVYEIVFEIVIYTKEFITKPFKVKNIKRYVFKGENFIEKDIIILKKYADSVYTIINLEDSLLGKDYLVFLLNLRDKPDSYEYYAKYNPIFLDQYDKLYQTKKLTEELKLTSIPMIHTYQTLLNITSKRHKIKQNLPASDTLFYHIMKINDVMEKLLPNQNK